MKMNKLHAASLTAGVTAAVVVGFTAPNEQSINQVFLGDRNQAAVDALKETNIFVPKDGRAMLSESEALQLQPLIDDSPIPIKVLVRKQTHEAGGMFAVGTEDAIAAAVFEDEPGILFVWEGSGHVEVSTIPGYEIDYPLRYPEDEGKAFFRITEWLENADSDSLVAPKEPSDDPFGGVVGGFFFGLLVVPIPAAVAGLLLGYASRKAASKLSPVSKKKAKPL